MREVDLAGLTCIQDGVLDHVPTLVTLAFLLKLSFVHTMCMCICATSNLYENLYSTTSLFISQTQSHTQRPFYFLLQYKMKGD